MMVTHLLAKKCGCRGRVQGRGSCNLAQQVGHHASHRGIVQQQRALASPQQGLYQPKGTGVKGRQGS